MAALPALSRWRGIAKSRSCGICATEYRAIKGIRRNVTFPFIPGREPGGVVARVGPGVVHFKEGDEVICQPSGCCGYCKYCRTGNTHYWEWGTQGTQTVRFGDQDRSPSRSQVNGMPLSSVPWVRVCAISAVPAPPAQPTGGRGELPYYQSP